uniref:ARAD1A00110p n=1 Tax=Blastobotrys adeninivorans TaxID=409370 RepID=A0A060T284_BLAAD
MPMIGKERYERRDHDQAEEHVKTRCRRQYMRYYLDGIETHGKCRDHERLCDVCEKERGTTVVEWTMQRERLERAQRDQERMAREALHEDIGNVLQQAVVKWTEQCAYCQSRGRPQWHSTLECEGEEIHQIARETAKYMKVFANGNWCKFCKLPGNAHLQECNEQTGSIRQRQAAHMVVGLASQSAARWGKWKAGFSWWPKISYALGQAVEFRGLTMSRIARDMYVFTKENMEGVTEDAEDEDEGDTEQDQNQEQESETDVHERMRNAVVEALETKCPCKGNHRLRECSSTMETESKVVRKEYQKLRFRGRHFCKRTGLPLDICHVGTECKYDRIHALEALFSVLYADGEKYRGKKEVLQDISKLAQVVVVQGQRYSKVVVEIAESMIGNIEHRKFRL